MESDRINATSEGGSDGLQRMRPLHGRTTGPTRRSTKGQWTADEDEVLHKAVQRFKGKNWKKIAECFKDRTDVQCLHRWQKVLNPELVKGPWSKEEDKIIIELVNKIGPKKWTTIAQHLPGRIGKQCRERWHNHLNPNINKEAWTQEEELILIRAHQVYGNKWAELTKFLPGRTDNAIKNHWNSSVKKKLDSYLASGLLAQIQGMPHISHINQSMPSSSSTVQQSSGDDSVPKDEGTETEAISECSQGSSAIGVLPANDIPIAITEERELTKASNHGKDPSFSAASCSERYNSKFEEVVPEVPCELRGSPNFLNHTYSIDGGNCAIKDWKINPNELPTISSVDMGQEFLLQCINVDVNQELLPFRLRTSVGFNASPATEKPGHMISEDDCHRVIYPEAEMDGHSLSGNFAKCPNISDFNGPSASLLYQPSNYQILDPPRTDMLENSCSQPFSVPSQLPPNDGALHFGNDSKQLNDISDRGQEMELTETQDDGIFYTNDYNYSPCDCGQYYMSMQDEPVQEKDSLKLVPVDIPNLGSSSNNRSFTLQDEPDHENDSLKLVPADVSSSMSPSNNQTCPSVDENLNVRADLTDTGSLFYEPPRFPSLDIPFFSCDLLQAGDDLQQEYSPLGIRQLMMSSVNCFSPFRLWDSPARDGSPDAVLKSAAKTFSCTPSILKKRNRDLVSPMSEKRSEKKLETDMNQELFSNLARDFSRLDVLFSKNGNQKAPLPSLSSHAKDKNISHTHDKENMYFDPDVGQEEVTHSIVDKTDPENDINENNFQDVVKPGSAGVNAITKGDLDAMTKNVSQPSGVLVEHNMNDMLFFSPDRFGFKSNNITYANQCSKRLDCTSSQGSHPESPLGNPCLSVVISPMVSVKKEKRVLVGAVSAQSAPALHPSELTAGSSGNDASAENLGIFGETPFKRNIESPSAWSSPWFINSFLPGPRVDTDITIEDIGYFMSPRDRSLDAIGLMKQLSEHNAAAFADAQEVLGHETPETILKGRRSKDLKSNQENSAPRNQPASHSLLASNFLTEKRVLDFSDCGTSEREKESSNISTSMSFSSPSSYLLKGCR